MGGPRPLLRGLNGSGGGRGSGGLRPGCAFRGLPAPRLPGRADPELGAAAGVRGAKPETGKKTRGARGVREGWRPGCGASVWEPSEGECPRPCGEAGEGGRVGDLGAVGAGVSAVGGRLVRARPRALRGWGRRRGREGHAVIQLRFGGWRGRVSFWERRSVEYGFNVQGCDVFGNVEKVTGEGRGLNLENCDRHPEPHAPRGLTLPPPAFWLRHRGGLSHLKLSF